MWIKARLSPPKAAKSAQETLEKTSVPSRTETVAAADLPTYISKLPKLLTEALTINVTGELTARLNLYYFYGPGRIEVKGSGNFSIRNKMHIQRCSIEIALSGIQFYEASSGGGLLVDRSPGHVIAASCQFQGLGASASTETGVTAQYGSTVALGGCSISGFKTAIISNLCSTITVNGSNNTYSDNATGAYVLDGSIIARETNNIPELFGGKANIKDGGIIINPNGTLM